MENFKIIIAIIWDITKFILLAILNVLAGLFFFGLLLGALYMFSYNFFLGILCAGAWISFIFYKLWMKNGVDFEPRMFDFDGDGN